MKAVSLLIFLGLLAGIGQSQVLITLKQHGETTTYIPKPISKELANSFIEEMWKKSPYSTPVSVEVRDDCMIAYYSDIKGNAEAKATKAVSKTVFYREITEIRIVVKGEKWYVLLRGKNGGLRNFEYKDEELALGFVDGLYYHIENRLKR